MSAAERAFAERAAQGLPPTVEDPAALRRVAILLTAGEWDERGEVPRDA